jgi:hypothetical protein
MTVSPTLPDISSPFTAEPKAARTPTDLLLNAATLVAPLVYLAADSLYAARGWDDPDAGAVHVLGAIVYAFVLIRIATWSTGWLSAATLFVRFQHHSRIAWRRRPRRYVRPGRDHQAVRPVLSACVRACRRCPFPGLTSIIGCARRYRRTAVADCPHCKHRLAGRDGQRASRRRLRPAGLGITHRPFNHTGATFNPSQRLTGHSAATSRSNTCA